MWPVASDTGAWVVFFFLFLLTFFFYISRATCRLFLRLFGCALSTFLFLQKKLSVLTSVNVFSLVRTKAGEPGSFFFLFVCVQGMCQGVFMGSAAELVSSG